MFLESSMNLSNHHFKMQYLVPNLIFLYIFPNSVFLQSCFLYLKFYSSHIYLLKSNTSYQPSNSLGLLVNRPTNQTVIKAALYYLVLLPHQDHTGILNTLPLIPTQLPNRKVLL